MRLCDRKCVQTLMTKYRRKEKDADFFIKGGAVNMRNRLTGKEWLGWPGLLVRVPVKNKDGSRSKTRTTTIRFGLDFCPICGGKI